MDHKSVFGKIALSYATAICFSLFYLISCTATKSAEQKQYEATQKELTQLQALRLKYPCDTSTQYIHIRDTSIQIKRDTQFVDISAKKAIGDPGRVYITETKTITHNVDRVVKVVDQAALKASRDSANQSMYLFTQCAEGVAPVVKENTALKQQLSKALKWRTGALLGFAILAIVLIIKSFVKL
jgi:hypothetical protein